MLHFYRQIWADGLHRHAVRAGLEHGSQDFVPIDDGREALRQCGKIQAAGQAQGYRDVVEGVVRLQLVQKPQALLGVG